MSNDMFQLCIDDDDDGDDDDDDDDDDVMVFGSITSVLFNHHLNYEWLFNDRTGIFL